MEANETCSFNFLLFEKCYFKAGNIDTLIFGRPRVIFFIKISNDYKTYIVIKYLITLLFNFDNNIGLIIRYFINKRHNSDINDKIFHK